MVTSQEMQLLRAGISEVFFDEFQKPSFYEKVFNVRNSNQEYEEYLHIAGLPNLMEWNSDGGELPIVEPIQGHKILFVHKDYGYMWSLSKRLLRGTQYPRISADLSRNAGQAALHTVEALATSVFAMGFTQQGYDGANLFGAHPLLDGSTFNNLMNTALAPSSLGDAIVRFRRMKNHRGQPIVIEPKYLIVPPELERVAKEIVNSTVVPVNNAFYDNVLKGIVEVIVNPYLTDPNDWFLVSDKSAHKLFLFWREKPNINVETDFRTQGVSTSINMALSVGYADWRGIVGASVT